MSFWNRVQEVNCSLLSISWDVVWLPVLQNIVCCWCSCSSPNYWLWNCEIWSHEIQRHCWMGVPESLRIVMHSGLQTHAKLGSHVILTMIAQRSLCVCVHKKERHQLFQQILFFCTCQELDIQSKIKHSWILRKFPQSFQTHAGKTDCEQIIHEALSNLTKFDTFNILQHVWSLSLADKDQ
jgi:hypothetical protein